MNVIQPKFCFRLKKESYLAEQLRQNITLLVGTVPSNNTLFGGTVLPNNTLFDGTVPPKSILFGRNMSL